MHIPPGSSNGWMKIETLEAVSVVVAEVSGSPTILCGDFNTPHMEMPDGSILSPTIRGHSEGKT